MRLNLRIASSFLALASIWESGNVTARTWYVSADGSGDAPSISAAADSSTAGDAIVVGPGTHFIDFFVQFKPGTSLISDAGPVATILQPSELVHGIVLGISSGCKVAGLTILSPQAGLGTIYGSGQDFEISGNIIEASTQGVVVENTAAIHHNLFYGGGNAITVMFSSGVTSINNNIILGRIYQCGGSVLVYCNDISIASACVSYGQTNFNLDPMFCGVDNYSLNDLSPCAPGNHPNGFNECGLIGPLPVECGTVKTEETTWGAVKALYRD